MIFDKLETDDLWIRPFNMTDALAVYQLSQEAALKTWIPDQVYKDVDQASKTIEFLISQYTRELDPTKRPLVFCVELKDKKQVIGHVGISPLSNNDVEIGYAIAESESRKGYATQAVSVLTKWAIESLRLHQVSGIVACENRASGKVLERAGYAMEQELMQNYLGQHRLCRRYSRNAP